MEEPIIDPPIPYVGPIPGGIFSPGRRVKIQGVVPRTAYSFNINLQCGPKSIPRDDVGMQVSVRVLDGYVSLNSLQNGTWGEEQYCLTLPIERGERFEIGLKAHPSTYEVVVNGQHFCDFPQRIRCTRITHLTIDGDVSIIHISYTSAVRDNVAAPGGGVGWVPQATERTPTLQIQNEIDGFEPINSNSASTPPPSYDVAMKQKKQIGFASADTPAAGPPYPTSAPYPPTGSSFADRHAAGPLYPTSASGPPYPTGPPYPPTGAPYPPTGAPYPTEISPTSVPGTGHTTPHRSSFEPRVRPNTTAYSISGRAQVPYLSGDLETGRTTPHQSFYGHPPPPGAPVPLNAAFSNFRPVQSHNTKKCLTVIGGIVFTIFLFIIVVIFNQKKHRHY